jgi:hypothetical protein
MEGLLPETLPDVIELYEVPPLIAFSFTVVLLKQLVAASTGVANIKQDIKQTITAVKTLFVNLFILRPPKNLKYLPYKTIFADKNIIVYITTS